MDTKQKLTNKAEQLLEDFVYSKNIKDLPDLIDTEPNEDILDNMNFELSIYFDKEMGGEDSFIRYVPDPTEEQWKRWEQWVYDLSDIILRERWEYAQAKMSDRLHDHAYDEDWKSAKHKYY